jgi:hypothetical protein
MPYYTRVDSNYIQRNNTHAIAAHEAILRNCPIPVYNATLGGALDAYPRVGIHG